MNVSHRTGRILVVDDDADFAEGLDVLLGIEGYEVAIAHDAAGAIATLDGFPAEVALIDVRLRNSSGIDLIAGLRETRPNLTCVMMTAFASTESAIEALQEGANDYLRKPIHGADLVATLDRCFDYLRLEHERRTAEQSFRESEARFRSLIDNAPSAHDLKDGDGRYRLVNPRFREWFADPSARVIGMTAHDLFPTALADRLADQDREIMAQGRAIDMELDVAFRDGTVHRIAMTKYPIRGPDGDVAGVGSICTDVSDRKEAEERLGQAQKMEAIGKLTGGVAHDFNNVLAVIMGYAEMMTPLAGSDTVMTEYLRTVRRAARQGNELTKRLLAFSRRQPLRPRIVDLKAMLDDMAEMLRHTLGATIELDTRVDDGISPVLVDSGQLETAVLNLALNARDAMPKGGRLVIKAANAEPDAAIGPAAPDDGQPGHVMLAVSDTGIGMSTETAGRAVEPFFTLKPAGEGTGLGLSMVYGFANQSGGHLAIDSEEGAGTTIRLYLPRAAGAAPPPEPDADTDEPAGRGERVLVVEDNADVRALTVTILESLGYRVTAAEDGHGALAALSDGAEIDLLLSDVVLPGGMSGPEIARAFRERRPGAKVLFMSAYADGAAPEGDRLPTDAELLDKPFLRRDLALRVRSLLDR